MLLSALFVICADRLTSGNGSWGGCEDGFPLSGRSSMACRPSVPDHWAHHASSVANREEKRGWGGGGER